MKRTTLITAMSIIWAGWGASAFAQQPVANAQPKPTSTLRLAFSPDGKSLAVAYGGVDVVVVWDLIARQPRVVMREKAAIHSVAYSRQGDVMAIGSGLMARLFDPKTGELRREFNAHQQTVNGVAFTPDGKQLATAGADGRVKLWDVATGVEQHVFAGSKGPIVGAAISADGKYLAAACGADDAVHLWNLQLPQRQPRKFDVAGFADRAYVSQVMFSPDSRFLAISNWSATVLFIDIASGKAVLKFTNAGVDCVALSPDGRWIALPSGHRQVTLASFQQSPNDAQRQQVAALIEQFQNDDYAMRESASRQLVELGGVAFDQLRAGLDSPIAEVRVRCRRVMERLQDLRFAKKLVGHEAEPTWVAFSPDGKLLASGDSRGTVKLWTIPDGKDAGTLTPDGKFEPPPPLKVVPAA
jgi:WD40 repeat protein